MSLKAKDMVWIALGSAALVAATAMIVGVMLV